jgi:hypothetical protein
LEYRTKNSPRCGTETMRLSGIHGSCEKACEYVFTCMMHNAQSGRVGGDREQTLRA